MTHRSRGRMGANLCAALAMLFAAAGSACRPATGPGQPANTSLAVRIVFVGDSLIHRSAEDYGMLDHVRDDLARRHQGQTIAVVDAGVNGNRIADIRERLDRDVIGLRPGAVVLYWDSDASDVDEAAMTPDEVLTLRAMYESNLRAVANRLVGSGAFVVMSGPTLLGEQPRHRNRKDAQLDAYRAINRRVASSLRISYVDTRRALFARRPPGTPLDVAKGLLTEDGEHLNARGVSVVESLFIQALDGWLRRTAPAMQ
jgi:lysophospholipase L1-like esterase